MTCREKLREIEPSKVDAKSFIGGCEDCPSDYFDIKEPEYCQCDEEICTKCWDRELPGEPTECKTDKVNHPSHYNREKAMECIDEMLMIFGSNMVIDFCILNAWKYRYRAADKNGVEDLNKSDWYLNKAKELMDKRDRELYLR